LRIIYGNKRVERYFDDYGEMKKKIEFAWVKAVKKHIDRLKASDTFGIFLKLGLGQPEPLKGSRSGSYSLRITGNVRLIIRPGGNENDVLLCNEITIEGLVDYHGGKETWYIP
jgi:proteic killer suppression protein